MHKLNYTLILIVVASNMCVGQNKWIWSKTKLNSKIRSSYPTAVEQYSRADRDREPTTKRPIPGQPQNDDIDDYTDASEETAKQNNPYAPRGYPIVAGYYNGFGNHPQPGGFLGNAPNGILVGPGGPTGIIGRPQPQYPVGVAPSSFPAIPGGPPGGGYPTTQNFAGVSNNPGYPGFNGLNNVLGQYPYASTNNPQQFPGGQYPQAQFPGLTYPQQAQYTEGYGLANANHGFNVNPQFNGNFNPNYNFGFDEYPAQIEGKSANVKAFNKNVDDKVAKNLKKS